MSGTWRDSARPVIARVIAEVGTEDMKALKAALRAAYPFGPYDMHPRKIWLDEIRVQLGLKPVHEPKMTLIQPVKPLAGQGSLFDE